MLRILICALSAAMSLNSAASEPANRTQHSPTEEGPIPVAFVLTEGAVMIDFAGPWEVFQDVMLPSRGGDMANQHIFRPYIVSDTLKPIHVSGGMTVTPDYTFENAPSPKIVVVPAQDGESPTLLHWLRNAAKQSDVVMSVCVGATQLAKAGLLDGKPATTHHASWERFQREFPTVKVQRDRRFVRSDNVVYTSGGLSSGIDLALHIVESYFGHDVAAATARQMEYEGSGWMGDGASSIKYSEPLQTHTPADAFHKGPYGTWNGMLASPVGAFRITVHLWPDASNKPTGTVDSIDDDVYGTPIDKTTIDRSRVVFEVNHGRFSGKLSPTQDMIVGTWTQNDMTLQITFTRALAK